MNEEISVEAANGAINNLVKDIHKLQEPKTPTQEQINIVANNIAMYMIIPHPWVIAERAIVEWEKIRNKSN